MTFYLWSQTASDNDTADPTANLREGWSPSIVNNAIRALMAAAAKFRDDISGILPTTGTSTAYAVTTNQGLTDGIPDGFQISFRVHTDSGAAATLNPDSQSATPLRIESGVDLLANVLKEGVVYTATYVAADEEFMLHGYFDAASSVINIPFTIGDGSNVITVGNQNSIGPFGFDFEITGWSLLGAESATIFIYLLKCTYTEWDAGSTHPVVDDKMSPTGTYMTYSSATKGQDDTSDWNETTVSAGDIITPYVVSVTGAKLVYGFLKARKTS